jgi:hypothetical protein
VVSARNQAEKAQNGIIFGEKQAKKQPFSATIQQTSKTASYLLTNS